MIKSRAAKATDLLIAALCLLLIFISLVPILNMLARSLSSSDALIRNEVLLWPKGWNLDAYTTVLQATQNQSVDLFLALPLMLGGVTGAQLGVRMSEKLNAAQLRLLLALLVLLVAVRMAYDLTVRPDELYAIESVIK